MKFLERWDQQLGRLSEERFYLLVLSVMAALAAVIVTYFALILHRNFLTIACDTAVLQSAIVNTLHGFWFDNNGAGGPNILGSHTTFLLLLIMPIYVLFPSADTLFILQVWGVYSTVIPLYLVVGEVMRRPLLAFFIAAAALASPLLLHMAVSPFHLETWIAAAVFWSYYLYLRNKLVGFCVSLGFAVCCGEQAALIYIALGLALLLVEDGLAWRKRYGWVAIAAGLFWIILAVKVIEPFAGGTHTFNIFAYNYTEWEIKSVSGLPIAVAQNPFKAVALMVNPFRWAHVAGIIGLPLFVALFSWRSLILFAPVPVFFLMCDQEFYLYFHAYYYTFAFVAGYLGVLFFLTRRDISDRFAVVVMAGIFFVNIFLLCSVAGFYMQFAAGRDDAFSATLREAFDRIPPEAAVYTPHRYSAYLSNRETMVIGDLPQTNVDFNAMVDAQFGESHVSAAQIDYIVCDLWNDQCGWRQGGYNPETIKRRSDDIDHLLKSGEWQVFWSEDDVVILKRAAK